VTIRGRAAIVGMGATSYFRRGTSDKTLEGLVCEAILTACEDAGLDPRQIDGFSSYSDLTEPNRIAPALGLREVKYCGSIWGGGGGGMCAAFGNAAAAICAGFAEVIVLYHAMRRTDDRRPGGAGALGLGNQWSLPYGIVTPAQQFAMIVRRHMYEYGTTSEHMAAQAIAQRHHAMRNPLARFRSELTLDEYYASRMVADPFRLFDCTLENDGGVAMIITSVERARDLKQTPAVILATSQGGDGAWGYQLLDQNAPPDLYSTAGHGILAKNLYERADIGLGDVDVAQLYDHFSGMVLLQLEDYGFCARGESGPYVEAGNTEWGVGRVPVNTSGGNLSEASLHGTTHVIEAIRQLRGTSTAQVEGAETCLVTAGPSPMPSSSMILAKV
jgi:acetyl-CoA acetyltransferase